MVWLLCFVLTVARANIPYITNVVDSETYDFEKWYLENASSINIISNLDLSDALKNDMAELKQSYKIFNNFDVDIGKKYEVSEGFHIISSEIANIIQYLQLYMDYPYKSEAYFLVSLYNNNYSAILEQNKKINIKHFVIILMESKRVLYYNNFRKTLNYFNISQRSTIIKSFYGNNYNGMELRCTLFDSRPTSIQFKKGFVGIDPLVFRTIANRLNFTLTTHEPYDGNMYGNRDVNGTNTGAILELYTNQCDVSCNQVFLKSYNAPELKFTSIIYNDQLCVVVPKAMPKPLWITIFTTYHPTTWAYISLTTLTMILVLIVIRTIKTKMNGNMGRSYDMHMSCILLDVVQMTVNIIPHKYFSNYIFERIFLSIALMYTLIINTSFQGALVTVIRHPKYYPNIDTLEDLDKAGYQITTYSSNLMNTFSESKLPHVQSLDKKLITLPRNVSIGKAFLSKQSKIVYSDLIDMERKGFINTHMVAECPNKYLLSYMTHKDAFFYSDICRMLDWLISSGFIRKWQQDIHTNVTLYLRRNASIVYEDNSSPKVFNLKDVQTSFYILILGTVLASILFLLEYHKVI